MPLNLSKGEGISLNKVAPSIQRARVCLGWEENIGGQDFDLDASAFLLAPNGRVKSDQYVVFYNQLATPERSVVHSGDDLTGGGGGDCEILTVELTQVPQDVDRIVFTVTIHNAEQRRQTFGQVSDAYIRLVDDDSGVEVLRYDLATQATQATAMSFAELRRDTRNSSWQFSAIGEPRDGGLMGLCQAFGVNVN